jgi:hypothetical protein
MPIAIIAIAVLIGGGTSFAAEGALPGDTLYPIKVGINEEVRAWIALSSEAQARLDARLAERRLEEAERLAAQGRLDAEARADLEARFAAHAEAFADRAAQIEETQGAESAFALHSNFEASLAAHEDILARLAADEEASVRTHIGPLLIRVRTELAERTSARANAEAEVSAEGGARFESAAEGALRAAKNALSEATTFVARAEGGVDASVYTSARAKLTDAESAIARGEAHMEAEAYSEAFVAFQTAIRLAHQAQLLVSAQMDVNLEVRVPSIDTRVESNLNTETRVETNTETDSGTGSTDAGAGLRVNVGI